MIKKVAAINDLSGAGRCSLTVTIPILSALGVQACPLPTAVLSNQTGYPHYFIENFTDGMVKVIEQWKKHGFCFDGIYTGFLSDEKQADIIKDFVKEFKREKTIFLVDPVMGDNGKTYPGFNKELIKKLCSLAFDADIITPNLTECCVLLDLDYKSIMKGIEKGELDMVYNAAKGLLEGQAKTAVITGIPCCENGEKIIQNAVADKNGVRFVKGAMIGGSYSGTGDIFSSILCGMIMRGKSIDLAVELATKFVETAVRDTIIEKTDRNHGINFEKFMYMLTDEVKNID